MQSLGVRLLERMDRHAIVGVWEIVRSLGFIRDLFRRFAEEVSREKPDLAVLIDYPGFNLELAKMLYKKNIPCVYYITPQLWAWGGWRIHAIKKLIKKVIVIFKFEETFFKNAGVDASFVGHPLLDERHTACEREKTVSSLGLNPDVFTIGLLPGSRPLEINRILPPMIQSARLIQKKKTCQFIIFKSPNVDKNIYDSICGGFNAHIIESHVYDLLGVTDFVMAASGTATLQVAIAEKPMLITYITSPITYFLAKLFVRIPLIGLVNIISGGETVPEIIQLDATPEHLASTALNIIEYPEKIEEMKRNLRKIKELLGSPGASERAAKIIAAYL